MRQRGFGLMEVLLALAISAVVMLVLVARQLDVMRYCYRDYFRSVAINQAQSMLERLRVNASDGARRREYVAWNTLNYQVLPEGHGSFSCRQFDHRCVVSLHWSASGPQAYSLSARVS